MYTLRFKVFWLSSSIALTLTLLWLSLLPVTELPDLEVSDKFLHFTAYFLLTTWFVGFILKRYYLFLGIALLVFSYGIEVAQGLSKYRQFEWLDLVANGGGIVLALLMGMLWLKGWSSTLENFFLKST